MTNDSPRKRAATHIILILASIAAALPIVGVLFVALDPPDAAVSGFGITSHMSFANLVQVWQQGDFARGLMWSAAITAATATITTVLAVPAGYALAGMPFRGRGLVFGLFLFGLLAPYAGLLIPLYYQERKMSIAGSFVGVVLPSAALSIAFGVFWMRAAFRGLPRELVEAARIDGASSMGTLVRVVLPLSRSAVSVLVLLTSLWTWNAFMVPLVLLAGSNIQTATMTMAGYQGGHVDDVPGSAASALFVALPMILLYVCTQRRFIRGMTEGGLKL